MTQEKVQWYPEPATPDLFRRLWSMIGTARADLTDEIYWEMTANPNARVPYLVR